MLLLCNVISALLECAIVMHVVYIHYKPNITFFLLLLFIILWKVFFRKRLYFLLAQDLGGGSKEVKKLPSGYTEAKALMPGDAGAPHRLPGFAVFWSCLRMSLSKAYLLNATWAPASLRKSVRWSPTFLMSFTFLSRKWFSRKAQA